MKLLITTQIVDKNDPILGFFHRWVEEFAKHCDVIHVICLKEGEHRLPKNVFVHSLGKEKENRMFTKLWLFAKYVFLLRKEYDVVFSHMNPHYIVLAGLFWKINKKKVFFWRNHSKMNTMTWIAAQYAKKIFYTSPYACTSKFKHSIQMPVGIDTGSFYSREYVNRNENRVLFLGRLSPVKKPELFLRAAGKLKGFKIDVYGDVLEDNVAYRTKLHSFAGINTNFYGAVSHSKTPDLYSACGIYVNLTPSGSMDKTVLEAAACGALVLVANPAFSNLIPNNMLLKEANETNIVNGVKKLSALPDEKKVQYRKEIRNVVVKHHSLEKLAEQFFDHVTT